MWFVDDSGNKLFKAGDSDWGAAAEMAQKCLFFRPDDEDEWVADESCSCYNCRYRRWEVKTFACMKG